MNWSTNDAIVIDLGDDTDKIVYAGFGTLGNAAIPGESLGTIIGSSITRNSSIENFRWLPGDRIVNNQGSYDETFEPTIIGDANPDWIANISNSISYKNLNFSFLLNYQQGGDIFTYTVATLLGRGLTTDTLDRELSFILPGVNSNGQQNGKQINNSTFYFSNVLYGPDEMLVYDASHWRLGEISLSYSLPQSMIENTPFGNISITASGFNLFYNAYNTPEGTNFDRSRSASKSGCLNRLLSSKVTFASTAIILSSEVLSTGLISNKEASDPTYALYSALTNLVMSLNATPDKPKLNATFLA